MSYSSSSSSSGEEDGDANWRAAIDSVASTTAFSSSRPTPPPPPSNQEDQPNPQKLKYYQLKAQKLLDDMLAKTIEVVSGRDDFPHEDSVNCGGGVQLFKHAPRGIVFDHVDEFQGPIKKPRILPGKEIDEKSKEFKRRVQFVAVDGTNVIAAAKDARQRSLAKVEAREAAAKAAAKREEERVSELKKVRGERWLPCMAKEKQDRPKTATYSR